MSRGLRCVGEDITLDRAMAARVSRTDVISVE
jgi:hypothetical protein